MLFSSHRRVASGKECNIFSSGPSVPSRPIFVDNETSIREISFLLQKLKKKIQKSLTFSFSSRYFFPRLETIDQKCSKKGIRKPSLKGLQSRQQQSSINSKCSYKLSN